MAGDIDKAMMNAECYKLKDTSFKLQEGTNVIQFYFFSNYLSGIII